MRKVFKKLNKKVPQTDYSLFVELFLFPFLEHTFPPLKMLNFIATQ